MGCVGDRALRLLRALIPPIPHLCATLPRDRADAVFNVGVERFGTMREDFQTVLDRACHGKRVIGLLGLPAAPAIWLLKLLEALGLSPLYQWIYETAAKDGFVSTDRIRERLGFVARYSDREALIRNYDWDAANRGRIRDAEGVTHRAP